MTSDLPPEIPPERSRERWTPISRLEVFYRDDHAPELVGGLAVDARGRTHFQYAAAWIESRRELSPVQLPLARGREVVSTLEPRKLHGLHGLFADSLPDAWGTRVLDLALRRHGIDPQRAGPLDRLAFLGARTMGALTYRPVREGVDQSTGPSSIDRLAEQAEQIAAGSITTQRDGASDTTSENLLDELERAVGSAGGAQPKALIAVSPDGATVVTGSEPPPSYTPYLLKFTPRRHGLGLRVDTGALEQAYATMAREAGVQMPRTRLFATADGRQHFAVERFDRTATGGRRHIHTFGGLMGRDAWDDGDYDELFRLTRALSADVRPLEEVLRRLCFNLAVVNDDDHLKNAAFLLEPSREWTLAPAYDLTYSPQRSGQRGMSVDGVESAVTWRKVATLAARHGIVAARVREIRERVEASVAMWARFAADAGVPEASVREVALVMEERRRGLAG